MKPKKVQRVKPKESESFPLSYKQNIISQNAVSKVAWCNLPKCACIKHVYNAPYHPPPISLPNYRTHVLIS